MRCKVGCYGKLPVYSDFVRVEVPSQTSELLHRWLVDTAAGMTGQGQGRGRGYRFLLSLPGEKRALAGRLWSSEDSHGRVFPFVIYAAVPAKRIDGPLGALPLRLDPIWQLLGMIAERDGSLWTEIRDPTVLSLADIYGAIQKARLRMDRDRWRGEDVDALLRAKKKTEFLGRVFPQAGWRAYPRVLWDLLRALDAFGEEERPAVALRIPHAAGEPSSLQAAFWMRLLDRVIDRPVPRPHIFLPEDGAPGRATIWVLFRDPLPLDGEVMMDRRSAHEYVTDLTRSDPGAGAAGAGPFIERATEAIGRCDSLASVLEAPVPELRDRAGTMGKDGNDGG